MTMVEVLLATALLAGIAAAAASWLAIAGRAAGADQVREAQWRNAAEAVFRLVESDLLTDDFEPENASQTLDVSDKCRVADAPEGGALDIVTRCGGKRCMHVYRRESQSGMLVRAESSGMTRPLLPEVERIVFSIDEPSRVLTVRIEGGNAALTRSFRIE